MQTQRYSERDYKQIACLNSPGMALDIPRATMLQEPKLQIQEHVATPCIAPFTK